MTDAIKPGDNERELKVFDHGFVRLDESMADDLSVVNSARVSFAVKRDEMDTRDSGLIRFLMRQRHGTPFEHNSLRFHVRTPIFVAREWFRHRMGCLTGDTVVSFVDTTGTATKQNAKTIDQLWKMWTVGERNGVGHSDEAEARVRELLSQGHSFRAVHRMTGVGRVAVSNIARGGSTTLRDARWRVRKMKVRVLNEDTNEFSTGHINDMFDSGIQPVYRVTLSDGKQISATASHRFLTPQGWQTLEDAVGLYLRGNEAFTTRKAQFITNGKRAYQDAEWLRQQRQDGRSVQEMADAAGCSYHTIRKWLRQHGLQFKAEEFGYPKGHVPWNKDHKGYKLNRTFSERDKEIIRRARSGTKSNFWRGGISSERANIGRWTREQAPKVHHFYDYTCQAPGCGRRGGRLHAHHIVPVWLDRSRARDIGNLITICDACHRAIHRSIDTELQFVRDLSPYLGRVLDDLVVPTRRGCRMSGRPTDVIAVEYLGMQQTYDLSIEGPWHNFVANGMVVHNSFNEESARYHKLSDDFYVPDAAAVRTQVGKPGAYTFEPVDADLAEETRDLFRSTYADLYKKYDDLMEKGVAKEVARAILPFGIYTQFYWTLNARSLMNFLSLRNAPEAQYEIRVYAEAVERLWAETMPVTHESFVEFGRRSP